MQGNTGEQLELPLIARLHEPQSGRVMEVSGSQPGVQVYTANYLSEGELSLLYKSVLFSSCCEAFFLF